MPEAGTTARAVGTTVSAVGTVAWRYNGRARRRPKPEFGVPCANSHFVDKSG